MLMKLKFFIFDGCSICIFPYVASPNSWMRFEECSSMGVKCWDKLADYIEGIRDIQFNNDISFSHFLWEAKGNADWLAELEVLRSNFLFYNYDMMMNWFPFLCRALLVLWVSLFLYYLFLIQISSFKKEKKEKKKLTQKTKIVAFNIEASVEI